MILTNDSN
jgi:hypothetical protein